MLCSLMIVAGSWLARPAAVQAAPSVPEEATTVREGYKTQYPVPGGPLNLAVEAPGRIWFTAPDADGIGAIIVTSDPNEQTVRYRVDFIGLGRDSEPYDLVYAGDAIWFTLRGAGQIGRINPATREVALFPLSTPDSGPTGIDVGPDGQVWVAEATGRLSKLDPTSGSVTE
ncbi:MAG TPA: hypothetical protein VNK95_15235, partial [Caldilineaceae bacterium]|nr:hypothetical protein [Caldilineaceae bacterium]